MTTSKRGRVYLVEQFDRIDPAGMDTFHRGLPQCPNNYLWEEVELELSGGRAVYQLINEELDEMEHDRQSEFISRLRELGYDARADVPLG